MTHSRHLRPAVERGVEVAPEREDREWTDHAGHEPGGLAVTDEDWLAVLAICLSDGLDGDLDTATWLVELNRRPCLLARGLGFDPWELARFIERKTQPGAGTALGAIPIEPRHPGNPGWP